VFRFTIEKTKTTRTRKFSALPRIGIVLDVAGRKVVWRYAPLLETLLNLIERGVSRSNLEKIENEQMHEITFPGPRSSRTLDVKAKTIREEESRGILDRLQSELRKHYGKKR